VCFELGLIYGPFKNDAKAILAEEGVTNPVNEQLKSSLNQIEEEHHAMVFMYKSDKQRYGKLIEETENEMLQKKDAFSNTV
jgi:hypothetical protein